MEDHEGAVGFQMVDWVRRAIEGVNGRHLELGKQWFVADGGNKR